MAEEIRVPEVSDGVTEGTIVSLSVAVGDRVEADQTLLELETDKAVVAIPCPFEGRITHIHVATGDRVQVGQVIMEGEPQSGAAQPELIPAAAPAAPASPPPAEAPTQSPAATPPPILSERPPSQASREAVAPVPFKKGDQVAPAAPSVRRLARDLGVDIYQVQGSGPGGRISADDVRGWVKQAMHKLGGGAPAAVPFPGLHAQRPLPDFSRWGEIDREPLSRVRELTADAMSYTWSTIPMVTQYDRADITALESFRKDFNRRTAAESKLTMTAVLLKVCGAALRVFPRFNTSIDLGRKELIRKRYVHIGVAVDTPDGLLVPVLRDVDHKGIAPLATELNAIAERTRKRRISPADMEGGTFTISNLGGIGGTAFTPLVYAPQVAILGVSQASTEPVWDGTAFQPRLMLPLSVTYDHRVIDGADGARFLRWVCEAIRQPLHLVMKG